MDFQLNENFAFAVDTFVMYSKLHQRGALALPIIIPEMDLKHPVIDIELDLACHQIQPDLPVSSSCNQVIIQPCMGNLVCQEADVDEDTASIEDRDEDPDEADSDIEESQKSQIIKSLWTCMSSV